MRVAVAGGTAAVAAAADEGGDSGGLWGSYWGIWLSGAIRTLISTPVLVRCLPSVPFFSMFILSSPRSPKPTAKGSKAVESGPSKEAKEQERVVVAGGGVSGLVLGACLQEIGLPFEILEKSSSGENSEGADLALWPAATKILKELGVGATNASDASDFWGLKTYPARSMRICKAETEKEQPSLHGDKAPPAVPAPTANGGTDGGSANGVGSGLAVAAPETVLTKLDMDAVVRGEGEPFRLVGRQDVMSALLPLVEKDNVRRGVSVVKAEQSFVLGQTRATAHITKNTESGGDLNCGGDEASSVSCRVLVGANGIHSVCRAAVSASVAMLPDAPSTPSPGTTVVNAMDAHDGGEVCYRGVLDLREGSPAAAAGLRAVFEEEEDRHPSSMRVVYGDRIRYSWGFIDGARETGYWFVKQLARGQGWPEPLRTFIDLTGEDCCYTHQIQDRPPLARWSCSNITLLGDACHPTTPNDGQGACTAIEDALVLATLLGEYWEKPDGHIEAFFLYERARLAHTRRVQGEAFKHMKLGQLTSRAGIWLRELVTRSLPRSLLQKRMRAANVYNIDPWLERFRALKAKRQQRV
ncbi:unnamed protein product [Scytosiphon promiscuus]